MPLINLKDGGSMVFYDTCSLLKLQERAFREHFLVSEVTIRELENIKTSAHKDEDTKWRARNLVRLLSARSGEYTVVRTATEDRVWLGQMKLEDTPDNLILAGFRRWQMRDPSVVLYTDDLLLRLQAQALGCAVAQPDQSEADEEYKGWRRLEVTEDELAQMYGNMFTNCFGLLVNEYALLYLDDKLVDKVCWTGDEYRRVSVKPFKSNLMDTTKPRDAIQECAFDALRHAEVVALSGRAGCGKTLLALSYIMQQLEEQKIRKLYVIGHFEPLRGSRQLGFLPGEKKQKMLETGSLGSILVNKLGDISFIDRLMASDRLAIIPTSDIRGVEFGAANTKDSVDAVWLTEAQDVDCYTMMTLLQRCKEGTRVIVEGDVRQSDLYRMSGFPRMIQVFKGNPLFASVKLKTDYRSKIGILADKLME